MARGDIVDSFVSPRGSVLTLLDNGLAPDAIERNRQSMNQTLSRLVDEEIAYRLANGISIDGLARVISDERMTT